MVAGLKFLSKKGFNPANLSNQKRVWEREQSAAHEARRRKERADQLRRERDDEELARARGDNPKVQFLYQPPPGLEGTAAAAAATGSGEDGTNPPSPHVSANRQPGDDDAAAAFRAMLAGGSTNDNDGGMEDINNHNSAASSTGSGSAPAVVRGTMPGAFGTVLQGSSYDQRAAAAQQTKGETPAAAEGPLSNLEKAVGRRGGAGGSLMTLQEQIERFPALKHAPRQRGVQVGVSFKPLGSQIRNVRCLKCGVWGHSQGDRECQVSGWNPFAAPGTTTTIGAAAAVAVPAPADTRNDPKDSSIRHDASSEEDSLDRRKERKNRSKKEKRKRKKKHRHRRHKRSRRYDSDDSDDDDDGDASAASLSSRSSSLSSGADRDRRRKRHRDSRRPRNHKRQRHNDDEEDR